APSSYGGSTSIAPPRSSRLDRPVSGRPPNWGNVLWLDAFTVVGLAPRSRWYRPGRGESGSKPASCRSTALRSISAAKGVNRYQHSHARVYGTSAVLGSVREFARVTAATASRERQPELRDVSDRKPRVKRATSFSPDAMGTRARRLASKRVLSPSAEIVWIPSGQGHDGRGSTTAAGSSAKRVGESDVTTFTTMRAPYARELSCAGRSRRSPETY